MWAHGQGAHSSHKAAKGGPQDRRSDLLLHGQHARRQQAAQAQPLALHQRVRGALVEDWCGRGEGGRGRQGGKTAANMQASAPPLLGRCQSPRADRSSPGSCSTSTPRERATEMSSVSLLS